MKAYKFTGKTDWIDGHVVHQICALRDIHIRNVGRYGMNLDIEAGSIGGWIESEKNLSHDGNCWVGGNAIVYENAFVNQGAYVSGFARGRDEAVVEGNAWVSGRAYIRGRSLVTENASVNENAKITSEGLLVLISLIRFNLSFNSSQLLLCSLEGTIPPYSNISTDNISP